MAAGTSCREVGNARDGGVEARRDDGAIGGENDGKGGSGFGSDDLRGADAREGAEELPASGGGLVNADVVAALLRGEGEGEGREDGGHAGDDPAAVLVV